MIRCITFGNREHPALPVAEFNQLKDELFRLFPQYWPNPVEFEPLWRTRGEAVGQVCKRLRSHKPPPVTLELPDLEVSGTGVQTYVDDKKVTCVQ